jgi:hypothetical protein
MARAHGILTPPVAGGRPGCFTDTVITHHMITLRMLDQTMETDQLS